MENDYPFVITIVGAESSGKTVLAKQLAEALSCVWVPEYAREYLEKLDRSYEFEDLEEIAKGQLNLMPFKVIGLPPSPLKSLPASPLNSPLPQSPEYVLPPIPLKGVLNHSFELSDFILELKSLGRQIVIVDSGLLTIRMWARIKYGRTIPFVEEAMKQDLTCLYLLCRPRMEWESDPQREAPWLVDRVWIYNQYLKELVRENYNYKIVATG